jgi:hypothetical protein
VTAKAGRRQDYCTTTPPSPPPQITPKNFIKKFKIIKIIKNNKKLCIVLCKARGKMNFFTWLLKPSTQKEFLHG